MPGYWGSGFYATGYFHPNYWAGPDTGSGVGPGYSNMGLHMRLRTSGGHLNG
jgi:hypothetical protein